MSEQQFIIRKGGYYYRPNAQGYTSSLLEAGRYSETEAITHMEHCDPGEISIFPAPGERHPHWRVSVETSGETIVSIEPEMLAGREISEADEDAIRTAAHHLLAFIGDPPPPVEREADEN